MILGMETANFMCFVSFGVVIVLYYVIAAQIDKKERAEASKK